MKQLSFFGCNSLNSNPEAHQSWSSQKQSASMQFKAQWSQQKSITLSYREKPKNHVLRYSIIV